MYADEGIGVDSDPAVFRPIPGDPITGEPVPDALRQRVYRAGLSVTALVRSVDNWRRHAADRLGIGLSEFRALSRISSEASMTPKQLAEALDLTTGTVTALIDRLENAGYVRRSAHPNDRRSLQVELTPAGAEVMRQAFDDFQVPILAAFKDLPADPAELPARDVMNSVTEAFRVHGRR